MLYNHTIKMEMVYSRRVKISPTSLVTFPLFPKFCKIRKMTVWIERNLSRKLRVVLFAALYNVHFVILYVTNYNTHISCLLADLRLRAIIWYPLFDTNTSVCLRVLLTMAASAGLLLTDKEGELELIKWMSQAQADVNTFIPQRLTCAHVFIGEVNLCLRKNQNKKSGILGDHGYLYGGKSLN